MSTQVMEDRHYECVGGGLDTRCPRFMRGWRKFCAQVLQDSLKQAHFTGKFALRHNFEAGSKFSKRIRTQLDGGCSAWLWMHGHGSKDFTFSEVCEVVDFDAEAVLQSFHALFRDAGDINRADLWVQRRCGLTDCLWAEEGSYED
jgi:hypothetical protein